jgi:N-acetylmuramoyl-L-alanine amidase
MIALLATLALLQQAGDPPATLAVREGERVSSIPVVVTRLGAMVRSAEVLAPLGAVILQDSNERYRLIVGGTEFALATGVTSARVRGAVEPLASAPTMSGGQLYLPLTLLTELLPRLATGFLYDAAAGELRRFASVVSSRAASADSQRRPVAPARDAGAPRTRATPPPPPARVRTTRQPVVVLDAGHGGRDRGMRGPLGTGPRIFEADITLALARQLRRELESRGVTVVMTRDADTLIALGDRGHIANRAQGDLFISIHVNAANPRWKNPAAARGFETYFLSEAKTDDERRVAELENEAVQYEVEADAPTDDPLRFILNDMKQNEYLRESSALAQTMQRALGTVHPGSNRGVKQAGFVVLVGAFMPSVLVEVGFGSNSAEASYLSGASGQQALARAMADGTMMYLSRYADRRTTGAER